MITFLSIKSLRTRMLFYFAVPAVIIFMLSSALLYGYLTHEIYQKESKKISAIRDLKMQEINAWLSRLTGDMNSITKSKAITNTGYKMCTFKKVTLEERESLSDIFDNYLNNYNVYYELFIVSSLNGKIVFSTIKDNIGADRSKNLYLTETLRNDDMYIKDIYYSSNLNVPTMTISMPLQSPLMMGQKTAGVFVARIYLERSLFSLMLDRTGLGSTGESIIINENMVALNKLMGYDGFPLTLKMKDEASINASQGKTGMSECYDYRGKKVLAAYSYINTLKWGFIVKQDIDEIYSSVNILLEFVIIFIFVISGIISAAAISVYKNITNSIEHIKTVSEKIKDGEVAARCSIIENTEFKQLNDSFNSMVDIIIAQLDTQMISFDIIREMVSTLNLEEFSKNVLKKFVEVSESSLGAFYMLTPDGREFKHITSIGLDTGSVESFHAGRLEGEFGKALATREIAVTRNISGQNVLKLRTTVGDVAPVEIMTIPIIVNNKTVAIISLASMSVYQRQIINILNQVRPVMNTAFSNILADEETRRLAKELAEKNQLLVSQKEELVSQAAALTEQSEKVKKQNLELESQQQKVEEANKLKSEFLSNMSHELRTPLNSILSLSHVLMLQTKEKITEEEMGYLEVIDRNGAKLLTLINDILDLSKIESGRIDLKIRKLSLVNMINTIIDNLEQIASGKGIGLKLIVEGDIPEIESDESRVYQICQNIIQNAVKFTDQGGVSITIAQDGERVKVIVEDTGIGINEKDLPHIFEEFRQIDGTLSRKYDGTGLGLTIAAKSASLIAAVISVRSRAGVGSSFEVAYPVKWQRPQEDRYNAKSANIHISSELSDTVKIVSTKATPYNHVLHNKKKSSGIAKILIVDDDKDNIVAVRAILNKKYKMYEAFDGDKAIELVYSKMPDIILLDMALPGKSGFVVARELKSDAQTRHIPILALTALHMTGDRERILEAGCDDYIAKPVPVELLKEKIADWLNNHE